MLIKIKKTSDISSSEVTPKSLFLDRRRFLKGAAIAGTGLALSPLLAPQASAGNKIEGFIKGPFSTDAKPTDYDDATGYNNFYEFGTDKEDPARLAGRMKTKPWSLAIEGEVEKPGVYDLEDILKPHPLEERTYRFRCVEAWSMVIPWLGFPLADLIKRLKPTSKARFVAFQTLFDPEQMPGQSSRVLRWPYVEGLRMDEAVNPLSFLSVGLYGEELPNQNGAPIRLVLPWKYGFKSIKSIVKISFVSTMPPTSWNRQSSREYGFYANVNPKVNHPRWSQARERPIGHFLKRKTLMFNGYGEQVAALYADMDLEKLF
jgi:methionine sulfoxide reductase catalytic subunit